MRQQIKDSKRFRWNEEQMTGAIILKRAAIRKYFRRGGEGWKEYDKEHEAGYYTYSIPVFNLDKTMCLFYESYHCGGLCGDGGFYIYKLTNGKWEMIAMFNCWVS